eukprot:scaffold132994_cov17-Tisochrysis_lutea.AAC.1
MPSAEMRGMLCFDDSRIVQAVTEVFDRADAAIEVWQLNTVPEEEEGEDESEDDEPDGTFLTGVVKRKEKSTPAKRPCALERCGEKKRNVNASQKAVVCIKERCGVQISTNELTCTSAECWFLPDGLCMEKRGMVHGQTQKTQKRAVPRPGLPFPRHKAAIYCLLA